MTSVRQKYRTLIELAPDPMFLVSMQSQSIIEVNDQAADLLGSDPATLEGRTVTDIAPIGLASLLERCWGMVRTTDAVIEIDVPEDATIEDDTDRLQQVFENPFRNTIEYGSTSLTVRIGRLPEGEGVYIEDGGTGLPDDAVDIFALGETTTEAGSGVGLAIAAAIIDAHGWDIRATEPEAGGARFEITGLDINSGP